MFLRLNSDDILLIHVRIINNKTYNIHVPGANDIGIIFMLPTLENLKGHFASALSVHPSVRPLQNLLRYSFEISYMDSSSKK